MTGRIRAELYRQGIGRAERAIREGFYIEAIAIQESVIADRLEYLLEFISGERRFHTLGRLLSTIRSQVPSEHLDEEVLGAVAVWSDQRNIAIHRMVKYSDFHDLSWRQRLADCSLAAEEGKVVMRAVDAWVRRTKRRLAKAV